MWLRKKRTAPKRGLGTNILLKGGANDINMKDKGVPETTNGRGTLRKAMRVLSVEPLNYKGWLDGWNRTAWIEGYKETKMSKRMLSHFLVGT